MLTVEHVTKRYGSFTALEDISLELTDAAKRFIARSSYTPSFGARPVKRTIQRYVVNDLSKRILAGEVDRSKPIRIDAANDALTFEN